MDLAKEFAPIFWFHENETYLPIDVKAMAAMSDLHRDGRKVSFDHTLEELAGLGKDYNLALKDINLGYPDPDKNPITSPRGSGPKAVSEHIKNLYNEVKDSSDFMIYTRVGGITIDRTDFDANVWSGNWRPYNSQLPGNYMIIQYFPFYVYNDFMNKHVGDWDSTVEIIINDTQRFTWIRTYMHHYAWFSSMGRANQFTNINSWLKRWQNIRTGDLGSVFNVKKHPFIFVSLGGHGCYPTPGYSLYGIKVKIPLLNKEITRWALAVDERQIGKVCLIPEDSDVNESDISQCLNNLDIDVSKLRTHHYKLESADNQPWSTFRGRWGNRSKLNGWDSPDSAPNRAKYKITKGKILRKLEEELKVGYEPQFIFQNYHGLL